MSNKDLELLKFYHEVGVDSTLTEGEEEKNWRAKRVYNPLLSKLGPRRKMQIRAGVTLKMEKTCFQVTG